MTERGEMYDRRHVNGHQMLRTSAECASSIQRGHRRRQKKDAGEHWLAEIEAERFIISSVECGPENGNMWSDYRASQYIQPAVHSEHMKSLPRVADKVIVTSSDLTQSVRGKSQVAPRDWQRHPHIDVYLGT